MIDQVTNSVMKMAVEWVEKWMVCYVRGWSVPHSGNEMTSHTEQAVMLHVVFMCLE